MENLTPLNSDPSDKTAILEQIRNSEFLSDLGEENLVYLADWFKAYRVTSGETIFKEGSMKPILCVIVSGEVSIFKEVSPFESVKIVDVRAGGVIGELGIIDGEAISASAIASRDTIVLIMQREEFEELVGKNGDLGARILWKIAAIISLRLRQTTGLLADLSMSKESRMLKY